MNTPSLVGSRGVTATPLAAAEPKHPDAELLAAWEKWLATMRANYADLLEEEQYFSHLDRAADSITSLPAHTTAGIVVKLKLAFHEISLSDRGHSIEFVARDGTSADRLPDQDERLLWNAIENLQQIDGRAAALPMRAHPSRSGAAASLLATAKPDYRDAALLQAWADWLTAEREYDAAPPGVADDRGAPHSVRREAAQELIEHTQALTPAGAAARVRLALAYIDESGTSRDAMLDGQSIDDLPEPLGDFREVLLWRVIEDLERMAAA